MGVWGGVRVCDMYVHMRGFCACVFVSVHGELCGVCLRGLCVWLCMCVAVLVSMCECVPV